MSSCNANGNVMIVGKVPSLYNVPQAHFLYDMFQDYSRCTGGTPSWNEQKILLALYAEPYIKVRAKMKLKPLIEILMPSFGQKSEPLEMKHFVSTSKTTNYTYTWFWLRRCFDEFNEGDLATHAGAQSNLTWFRFQSFKGPFHVCKALFHHTNDGIRSIKPNFMEH